MAVQLLAVALVEDHEHRVFLALVEVLGSVKHALGQVAGIRVPFHELRVAPVVVLHLRVGVGDFGSVAEIVVLRYPHIRRSVEVGTLVCVHVGVLGLAQLRERVCVEHLDVRGSSLAGGHGGITVALVGIVKHREEHLASRSDGNLLAVGLDVAETAVGLASLAGGEAYGLGLARRVNAPDVVAVIYEQGLVAVEPPGNAVRLAHHRYVLVLVPSRIGYRV